MRPSLNSRANPDKSASGPDESPKGQGINKEGEKPWTKRRGKGSST
jgi:hypothetical protein